MPPNCASGATRMTKDGRSLTYQLRVIQQPERARACGSGAKSSADRRPVDPPPVVELRIYEGNNDVTFSYNANFFLFATLEPTRQIAHGRVPQTAASVPVLTGMPVAGMAYLDRPAPAGYFIFPDLSVRHEGKYRLSFNLYEEVKDPKDEDVDQPNLPMRTPEVVHGTDEFVHWRLEVKSIPFIVFSAKKFPGLAESTALSRTIAEQGCRMRIRRDVRMRRRNNKAYKDGDYDDEESIYARRTATPEVYASTPMSAYPNMEPIARARSVSNSSVDGPSPYAPESQSRPPTQQGHYHQPSYQGQYAPPPPVAPQSASSYSSHLSFGNPTTPHYQTPQYGHPQPVQQPAAPYSQPHPSYHPPPSPRMAPSAGPRTYSFSGASQYQGAQYPQQPHSRHDSLEHTPVSEYRRGSAPAASQSGPVYPHQDAAYNRHQAEYQPYNGAAQPPQPPRPSTPATTSQSLPPLKTLQPSIEPKSYDYKPMSGPYPAPPTPTSTLENKMGNYYGQYYASQAAPQSAAQSAPASAAPESARSSKRSYGSVFNSSQVDQPLHNGMRPSSPKHTGLDIAFEDDDDDLALQQLKMRYKRADGTEISRRLPASD